MKMFKQTRVRRILTLLYEGHSEREIARMLHVSRNTIAEISMIFRLLGKEWKEILELEDETLNEIFRPGKFQNVPDYALADYQYVHSELRKTGVTLKLLWMEYCEKCQKTYLACALGVEACRHSFRTLYIRMSDFLRNLEHNRDNIKEMNKYLRRISNYHVLIMDEWLSHIVSDREAKWLYELLEMRKGNNPTLFVGQYATEDWHDRLGGGTMADSIMDRIIYNSYPIKSNETNIRRKYDELKLQQFLESMKD